MTPGPDPATALELGPAASRRVADRDRALAGDGWQRRFIGGPPRLQEMLDLYGALGHDVHTETLRDDDLHTDCAGCTLALALFRIVYTRRPQ